jgi:hypothetical protein
VRLAWIVAIVLSCAAPAVGKVAAPGGDPTGQAAPSTADDATAVEWSFSAAAYTYLLPDESNYAQPTVTADRSWLHLEARYNYEELDTGSLWAGYNFAGGQTLEWELTPMVGGVFGATTGIAPGYKGALSWWKLGFSSEGEYVFDATDSAESFFYNWSELTLSPHDWWRVGLVTQRTRAYAADREIQRGLLGGVSVRSVDAAVYVFNPDDNKPIVVLAVTVGF